MLFTLRRASIYISVLTLVCLAIAGCTQAKKTPPEQVAAQRFLTALGSADAQGAAQLTTDPTPASATIKQSLTGLGDGTKGTLNVTGLSGRTKAAATASYAASWKLPGVSAPWTYTGSLSMVKDGNDWHVSWQPSALHPQLAAGSHFVVKRTQPARAALQDDSGADLFAATPVVTIGIDKAKIANLASLATTLAAIPELQTSVAEITKNVTAAKPGEFVPVITLRRSAYDQIRSQIHDLPGTVFNEGTRSLAPTARFAQPLLGQIGDATKEIVDGSSGQIQAGDSVGLSGLQRALNTTLTGSAGVDVYSASDNDGSLGPLLGTVAAPKAGTPVRLTLNRAVQNAADAALASTPQPAALVAVQPSTGKILAVANSAAANDNIAMVGRYPAGSTFKILTYTAAFQSNPALTADSPVACPPTVTVDGATFQNEDKFSHGTIPLSAAFAYSCNTTAIKTAMALPADAMQKAAASLGLGANWKLPVDSFSGSLPAPSSPTERAADAIGQGKVLVSPLLMASIAGASAGGRTVAPSLIVGQQATPGTTLSPTLSANMNALLRATVAQPGATATALADLPGEVRGKTGTAEFGNDLPPKSHSWFAGSRSDLAFAVFVYGGESSHTAAVPIAHTFLAAVAAS